MLWYGICAGLSPKNRIQTDYNHLGLRIQRWLSRSDSLLSHPACDISIHELVVLLRGDLKSRNFRQTHSSFLRIEIVPLVTTVVKWPARHTTSGQMNLFASDERPQMAGGADRLSDLIRSLRSSLALAEGLTDKAKITPPHPSPQQRGRRRR
jgi:hypothetical protein